MTKTLPPGQIETKKWPILHEGDVYQFDEETWRFKLFGEVEQEVTLTYKEVMALPKVVNTVDMHCVTTCSKFDTTFEGIPFRELMKLVNLKPNVRYVRIYGYLNGDPFGYSANLPLEALQGDDALFVYRWKDAENDWQDISPKHGYPLRFIPPAQFYLWKGSKWASGIEFMTENNPGYWEVRGYHMNGNPFKEERFADRNNLPSGYGGADEWKDL
ncbi:molybdopterin-dependent oxidoreductase [Caldalkalibacillus thermarum TA2.A1]|uniref:Molybdopterin-dependent oxidoreductase n=1 Tax=Caldalkalibacillus thermarum (strain TA2.A1) TaxID=986075 RepID=A0A8X8IAZ8_CALTT|nr:molybdopterin-dependent oxidoreductase [Caldalkalibacillus thermarum]QZT34843.1 molybdopterin-dependent oxidoreductase [Caldalkalibacillus thermarum TA2.A1]